MKLTIQDRLILGSVCPEKDNIDRLLIRKSIMEQVKIEPEESKLIELKHEGTKFSWNKEKETEMDAKLSEVETNYLRNCISELSNKKELHASMVELYLKIKG